MMSRWLYIEFKLKMRYKGSQRTFFEKFELRFVGQENVKMLKKLESDAEGTSRILC